MTDGFLSLTIADTFLAVDMFVIIVALHRFLSGAWSGFVHDL